MGPLNKLRQLEQQTATRVGKNALALFSMQGATRLLSLLLVGLLTRHVGTTGLGRYLLAMTVEAVALGVVDLGLNTLAIRELSRAQPEETNQAFWGTLLRFKLVAALLGIVVLNGAIAPLLFPGEHRLLIALASLALLPDSYNGAATALVKARQRMEVSSLLLLGINGCAVVGSFLLLGRGYDERAVLVVYLLASTLGAAAFALVLRSWKVRADWSAWGSQWKKVLHEAVPFAVIGAVAILYMRMDLLILSSRWGDAPAGVYGGAYRLWESLGLVPASLLDALFPEISRRGANWQDRVWLHRLYYRGRLAILGLVGALVVLGQLLAPQLIALLYGPTAGAADATTILRLLLLFSPLTYLYLLNGQVLYAVGRQRYVTASMVGVTALNGVLNLLLIPLWGYWGAAAVACLSEAALFLLLSSAVTRFVLSSPPSPALLEAEEKLP